MNEAFIRAIVDNPGDDATRLVYADWLDDRDDPRGPYLRAEFEWVKLCRARKRWEKNAELSELAGKLDPVWVARVSRPPMGACIESPLFRSHGGQTTAEEIDAVANHFGVVFPPEYRAFLLNHNGGDIYDAPPPDEDAGVDSCLWGIGEGQWSLRQAAEHVFGRGDESNRRSGLFPIGALDVGRAGYLLGVGLVGVGPSKLYGRVFISYGDTRPWTQRGEFVEIEDWDCFRAESILDLLPCDNDR